MLGDKRPDPEETPPMPVEVGQPAPEFTLRDQNREEVTLSQFRGKKNVLLVFYPFAFSGTCTAELCQVRDELPRYQNDDLQILGVSVDAPHALKAWAKQQGYGLPLLADFWPHGEVARAYGVFNDRLGAPERGTFIIDREGIVRWTVHNEIPHARNLADYEKALAEL